MYRKFLLSSLNHLNDVETAADAAPATEDSVSDAVSESNPHAASTSVVTPIRPDLKHPHLRASVRPLVCDHESTNEQSDIIQDIYEVSFSIDIPGCRNELDWTDVGEKAFYNAVQQFQDTAIENIVVNNPEQWTVRVFRSLDVAPGHSPTEFDAPVELPFLINHPAAASVGGASRHSLSCVYVIESMQPRRSRDGDIDYKVTIELSDDQPVLHQIELKRDA